jgi:sugar/nucleoside kinase (ribokinase family)
MTQEHPAHTLDVVGVGSPLVDVLSRSTETQLDALGLVKGSMTLVDLGTAEAIYAAMGSAVEASGGSAANTMAGAASLGARAGFVGKIARDGLGDVFVHDVRAAGVTYEPMEGDGSLGTGRCLVLVTGDAERTMATYLGAATTIGPSDLPLELIRAGRLLYLEGYLWDLPPAKEAMRHAMDVCHANDGSVALSLSDPFCVERHQREFLELVQEEVDVLFANEDEIVRLFGASSFEEALGAVEETGLLAALTRGARGSVVVSPSGRVRVDAEPVDEVVDTTGAGDLFAAGFLVGLSRGEGPERCARLGSLCAAEVISHLGARPQRDLAELAASRGLA